MLPMFLDVAVIALSLAAFAYVGRSLISPPAFAAALEAAPEAPPQARPGGSIGALSAGLLRDALPRLLRREAAQPDAAEAEDTPPSPAAPCTRPVHEAGPGSAPAALTPEPAPRPARRTGPAETGQPGPEPGPDTAPGAARGTMGDRHDIPAPLPGTHDTDTGSGAGAGPRVPAVARVADPLDLLIDIGHRRAPLVEVVDLSDPEEVLALEFAGHPAGHLHLLHGRAEATVEEGLVRTAWLDVYVSPCARLDRSDLDEAGEFPETVAIHVLRIDLGRSRTAPDGTVSGRINDDPELYFDREVASEIEFSV
jgi:hypothetical protein